MSVIACAAQLQAVRGRLRQLEALWLDCGAGRHDACCRCDVCAARRLRAGPRTPEHMPQYARLQCKVQALELRHAALAAVAAAAGAAAV